MPLVEQAIIDSGVIPLKYWLDVSQQEQTRRLEARIHDERKICKSSTPEAPLAAAERPFERPRGYAGECQQLAEAV